MASITAATKRLPWWVGPITVSSVLGLFTIYSLFVVFVLPLGEYPRGTGTYLLTPFYSPQVPSPISWLSPAVFVLWIPLGFRATCYYYRKAYYRSIFWDPPNCSSKAQQREPRGTNYNGETALFVLNNIHRYFLYGSIVVVAFLWYETAISFFPQGNFGITIGSLIFLTNIVLVSLYTFSCHSFRHLVGGKKDCFSCERGGEFRRKVHNRVTTLNTRHALWAWLSLFSLLFTDLYIRLLLAGVITDLHIIG